MALKEISEISTVTTIHPERHDHPTISRDVTDQQAYLYLSHIWTYLQKADLLKLIVSLNGVRDVSKMGKTDAPSCT